MKRKPKVVISRENNTFKELKKLARSPGERKKRSRALLEGVRLVEIFLRSGGVPLMLVTPESAAGDVRVKEVIGRCPSVPVLTLADRLFMEVSTVKTPSGLMADFTPPSPSLTGAGEDSLFLEDIGDPGNLGMILRSAAAAGVRNVCLTGGCADVWSPKVLRGGMGAHFFLNLFPDIDLGERIGAFAGTVVALDPEGEESLYDVDFTGPAALLVGSEGAGLSLSLRRAADRAVSIPMPGWKEALNAAAAASIALFELVRQRRHDRSTFC